MSTFAASRSEHSDSELLRLIAVQDEDALRSLFERHSPWLLLRLQRRSGDPGLVAEALQDTFVAVWEAASSFRAEGDVGAWLWGIAIRRLVTRLRGRPAPTPMGDDALHRRVPSARSAEDELLQGVEHGDVGSALQTLSPELRSVLQAVVIDGLSTREAAGLLGLPQGTVKSRIRAAKSQLRKELLPEWRA